MWIEKKYKDDYKVCDTIGIKWNFENDIVKSLRRECIVFLKWLQKEYWFPIKVEVNLLNSSNFFENKKNSKLITTTFSYQPKWDSSDKKIFPQVYIAMGNHDKWIKKYDLKEVLYNHFNNISHELTHYFQWFFYQFEKRTDRSLDIEANRWGHYLANNYIEEVYKGVDE